MSVTFTGSTGAVCVNKLILHLDDLHGPVYFISQCDALEVIHHHLLVDNHIAAALRQKHARNRCHITATKRLDYSETEL